MVSPAFLDVTIAPATAQQRIQQRPPLVAAIAQQSAALVQQQSVPVSCSTDLEPLIAAVAQKRTQAALAAGSGIGAAANAAAPVQQLLTAAQVWSRW